MLPVEQDPGSGPRVQLHFILSSQRGAAPDSVNPSAGRSSLLVRGEDACQMLVLCCDTQKKPKIEIHVVDRELFAGVWFDSGAKHQFSYF